MSQQFNVYVLIIKFVIEWRGPNLLGNSDVGAEGHYIMPTAIVNYKK